VQLVAINDTVYYFETLDDGWKTWIDRCTVISYTAARDHQQRIVFTVQSVLRCYKKDKLGVSVFVS
jgi:hypothetical protein